MLKSFRQVTETMHADGSYTQTVYNPALIRKRKAYSALLKTPVVGKYVKNRRDKYLGLKK